MSKDKYLAQTKLVLRLLPLLQGFNDLALKGGTAINFFFRDFPRLSVDIDLCYLPIESREDTLRGIGERLEKLSESICSMDQTLKVSPLTPSGSSHPTTLLVTAAAAEPVIIEVNYILRGSVEPPVMKSLVEGTRQILPVTVSLQTLSHNDLYAGKLCAALSRQHPRDLFDVKILLENEGITVGLKNAFLVYLISDKRPIHELLSPNLIDISEMFHSNFSGMEFVAVTLEELLETRARLISTLHKALTDRDREFLISVLNIAPKWELLDVPHAQNLPSTRWKLMNLEKMDQAKRKRQTKLLEQVLTQKLNTNEN